MNRIDSVQTLPARNFVAGFAKNPATFIAYSEDGAYYEGFVSEYASQDEFTAEALAYFNLE